MKLVNFILALINLISLYTVQDVANTYANKLIVIRRQFAPSNEITVKPKKRKMARSVYNKPKKLDWNISEALKEALQSYSGPAVNITSLRRHGNPRSAHYTGNAADFSPQSDFIAYLLSEEGKQWLSAHHLDYYIEDRHHSAFIKKYAYTSKTLVNGRATGPHVHLYVRGGHGGRTTTNQKSNSSRHGDHTAAGDLADTLPQ